MLIHIIQRHLSSLHGRVALLVWSVCAASMALYVGFHLASEQKVSLKNAAQEIESLTKIMASNVGDGSNPMAKESIRETLESAFLMPGITYAALYDGRGLQTVILGETPGEIVVNPGNLSGTELTREDDSFLVQSPVRNAHDEIIGAVVLRRSLEDVKARTHHVVSRNIALLLAILTIGLAAAIWFAKGISKPIMGLARAAEIFAGGEKPTEMPAKQGILEIDVLAEMFKSMMKRIEKHRLEIEEQKRTLEVKVQERTEELKQKNMELAFQNEKVMEANRLKTRFLANMSHELRTPLNGILAISEMLKEGMSGELEPEQQKQVEIIHRSGTTLLTLINDTLDLSLVESGRMEFRRRNVKIVQYLREEVEAFRVLAEAKNLIYEVVEQNAGDEEVFVDPDRIRQVLINMINNAIKFTDSGSVRVVLEQIRGGRVLRATVQDTGIGISSEDQATIFQEFRQLDATASRRHGGTGLGLAICKRLLNLMGGEIWVDSEEGMGTTFSVVIPLTQEEERAPGKGYAVSPTRDAVLSSVAGRILIIDEDQIGSSRISSMFRKRGIEVVLVSNGEEGLRALRNSKFHALLLSLSLPQMDSITILKAIESYPDISSLHIAVTASRDLTNEESEYLKKRSIAVFRTGQIGLDTLMDEVCNSLPGVQAQRPAKNAA
ncbi:MAG: response regulator [Candidatus Eisenbacteria bacterium]|uniref:histidine kinase n=1 Tax=Eiseniibacteriota bacterium TaxID=2212470 RepID=A0A948W885_UNCEI|nr:response regulator [Candidatus Eisenbacteria bacterium]MBU1947962.1 response regulator [Candidatus Eisenbacteria bacterium]MBU2693414.1 response regulator [Candidatus Eisenbacteria bacterium]